MGEANVDVFHRQFGKNGKSEMRGQNLEQVGLGNRFFAQQTFKKSGAVFCLGLARLFQRFGAHSRQHQLCFER